MKKHRIAVLVLSLILIMNASVFAADIDMRLYIKEPAKAGQTQNYHGAKFEPEIGTYLGMFAEGDIAVHNAMTGDPFYFDAVPKLTGKKHAMYMIYIHYGDMEFKHYESHYAKARETNCGMQVSLEPTHGLEAVQDNAYLHEFAKQAKKSKIPIFLRFANEMNDPGSAWGKDPALYIEKFRLVADVMHNEAPNVAMCWSPNDWGHNGFGDAHEWYPGDAYVDWVGVSSYPPYLANGESKHKTKYADRLIKIYNAYADRKPIYLSEGAPIQNLEFETTDVSAVAAKDLKEFYDEVARRYPAIKAIFYWDNEETWGAARKCIISKNPLMLDAYKKSIADAFFLSNVGDKSEVIYRDLSVESLPTIEAKPLEVSAVVASNSLRNGKVVYYLNGQWLNEVATSPYACWIDFSSYSGETVTIKADSYDLDGKLIKTIEQEVMVAFGEMTLENALKKFDRIAEAPMDISHFDKNIKLMLKKSKHSKAKDITTELKDGIRVVGNRSAVGVRDLANILDNVELEWNGEHRTVILKKGKKSLAYPLNRKIMYNGEKIVAIDTQATVDSAISKTFLPVRNIAEALGYKVSWDAATSTITLIK